MNTCETIYGVTPRQVIEAMKLTIEVHGYYIKLYATAPNEEQRGILGKIIEQNVDSYFMLRSLYISITCIKPQIEVINIPDIQNYLEGLMQAKAIEIKNLSYFLKLWISATDIYYTTDVGNIRTVFGIPANRSYLNIVQLIYIMTTTLCNS